ncbi:MAG: long-chain fatty acid--CoA ligase [Actinobacteria bacterium]|nr:MAG: long-chain fatty acid--CoA ligase [Actinomycetota bacterium]
MNLASILDAPAVGCPKRAAVVLGDDTWTYADLGEAVVASADRLAAESARPGERVPVVATSHPLTLAAILAAARLGAAGAALNPQLTAEELRQLAQLAGLAGVGVSDGRHADALRTALGPPGTVLTEADLSPGAAVTAPEPVGDGDDEALVLFTSGTTGLPKAVPMSHATLTGRIRSWCGPFDAKAPLTVRLMCVPMFHVGGLLGLLMSLYSGHTTVIEPRFDAGEWLELVERHRVDAVFLVPTMLGRILDHPRFARSDLSSLRSVAYGAAPAPPELVVRATEAMPHVAFSNVFGQTETLGAYTALSADDHRHPVRRTSVGRALPGVELRVVDPGSGDEVPEGEPGELWVQSAHNVRPGWLRTGDLARLDADGYVFPVGRLSDTINRGGEKLGPVEVETVLRAHPAVADAAVAALPDSDLGERVGAAVVARDTVTPDDLRAYCGQHLARFKVPDTLVLVDRLPYDDLGKVRRRVLAALIADRAESPERSP